MCATVTARWHEERKAAPVWGAGCPWQYETDAELPAWRVQSKRTAAGKMFKVYYGPCGETVRSRSNALQICALYGKVARTYAKA
eukprot:7243444-Prymnesium_polylepis.1